MPFTAECEDANCACHDEVALAVDDQPTKQVVTGFSDFLVGVFGAGNVDEGASDDGFCDCLHCIAERQEYEDDVSYESADCACGGTCPPGGSCPCVDGDACSDCPPPKTEISYGPCTCGPGEVCTSDCDPRDQYDPPGVSYSEVGPHPFGADTTYEYKVTAVYPDLRGRVIARLFAIAGDDYSETPEVLDAAELLHAIGEL
jgi:hypothetical protein